MKLLGLIDEYGLLSTKQIKKLVFQEVAKRTMLRRLSMLRKKGFLRASEGLSHGELTWFLTPKAAKRVGADLTLKSLNKNTLFHDVTVNEVRSALLTAGFGTNWKNGHQLKMQASRHEDWLKEDLSIPDGIFGLKTSSGFKMMALELEMVCKSKRRYQDTFASGTNKTISKLIGGGSSACTMFVDKSVKCWGSPSQVLGQERTIPFSSNSLSMGASLPFTIIDDFVITDNIIF